jgi:hypothetical protein
VTLCPAASAAGAESAQRPAGPWYTPKELKALIAYANASSSATARVVDHRSPDTIDAVAHGAVTTQPVELRSPDTRDAPIVVPSMPRTRVVVRETPAFDWADAGIGAAGGFAIALLLGGVVLLTQRGDERKLAL